ncbi:MAG TPA: RNA polymerase sigma factor [Polyangiales bacterium]|nr:RNA polymerase sigma factor [Polyangiales bacterium]
MSPPNTQNQNTDDLPGAVAQSWKRFLETYEPLRPALYRFARYLTRTPWDAEDLVQDSLARAFATLGSLHEPPDNPRAWLFHVASNLWIDQLRRRAARPNATESLAEIAAATSDTRDTREAAGTLLSQLSPQERAAVVLKDVFELSLEEIAAILSTSVGAVKAALHRGRGRLKEPDPELTRTPLPAALDAFVAAFNARDLDSLAALLLDHTVVEVVGASTIYGAKRARDTVLWGMVFGSRHMSSEADGGTCDGIDPRFVQQALPVPARLELRFHRGEYLLLSFYQHHDGEFVRAVSRVELSAEGDRIARLRNYFYTPEIIEELGQELGVPCRVNGTFRARGAS